MIFSDINIYSKLNFIPLYSVVGVKIIVLYRVTKEIVDYSKKHYQFFKFIYAGKHEIYKLLYDNVYKPYLSQDTAYNINNKMTFLIICTILIITIFYPHVSMLIMLLLYIHISIFKFIFTIRGWWSHKNILYANSIHNHPIFTILIPIKNEKISTIKSLIKALSLIDYPQDKLDIKLIVEEEEVNFIESIGVPFDIIKVPFALPQTKAKACNYALQFAKGKYLTIYDADDKPHSLQLKKTLEIFQTYPDIMCIQAPLNYYNSHYNNLTKFFALEYSNLFDFILHGVKALSFPILLGGSSNYFRIEILKKMDGWDPYNVTEDADLGIKLMRTKYKVHILHGYETLEEAPIWINSWIKQRARWIKGFLVTYIVHMKNVKKCIKDLGVKSFLGLQLLLIMPIIVYIFSPIFWIILFFIHDDISTLIILVSFILYIVTNITTVFASIKLRNWWSLIPHAFLMPVYHVLHSIASYRAMWQLFTNPYKWDKTEHDQSS